jgi:hypothetical protein
MDQDQERMADLAAVLHLREALHLVDQGIHPQHHHHKVIAVVVQADL